MSRIRTNLITNRMANGAPTVSNGLVISGVTTTSDIKVGTGVTLNVYGGATYSGIVTASSYRGDGSQLTGISVDTTKIETGNTKVETIDTGSDGHIKITTEGTEKVRIDSGGRLLVGTTSSSISSAELFEVKSSSTGFSYFTNNSSTYAPIYIDNLASNDGSTLVPLITFTDGGGNRAGFLLNNSSQFDISASGSLNFSTGNNVGSATQRMRILGDGRVLINTGDGAAFSSRKLTVSDVTSGGTTAMEIRSATNGTGRIYFTDSTSSSDAGSYAGKVYYDHNDDHMAFYTGVGTNTPGSRMKIDAYGRVTKPSQPLFVVQKSAVISGTGTVVFNTVIENVGSHYNSSNGRFTAPVAGYYWFCIKINAYRRIDFFLRRNGANSPNTHREIGQFNTSNQDGWYSHNLIRIFELAANDYVQVIVQNLHQNSDPGEWLTFQGYLLQ